MHAFLESGKQFSDWIKDRINKYDFKKGNDFIVLYQTVKNLDGGSCPSKMRPTDCQSVGPLPILLCNYPKQHDFLGRDNGGSGRWVMYGLGCARFGSCTRNRTKAGKQPKTHNKTKETGHGCGKIPVFIPGLCSCWTIPGKIIDR